MENEISVLNIIEKQKDNEWFGLCLDLDVSAQGSSYEEVKNHLENAVKLYIRSSLRDGTPLSKIYRPVPKSLRFRYFTKFFAYLLIDLIQLHKDSFFFERELVHEAA